MGNEGATERRRDADRTREAILSAAHDRFVLEGYDNVGLRDIAADARVDAAMIGRYFGNKERLFSLVVSQSHPGLLDDMPCKVDLPHFFSSLLSESKDLDKKRRMDALLLLMRSASSPVAGPLVRKQLNDAALEPLAALIQAHDAPIRARIVLSILIGAAALRSILGNRAAKAGASSDDRYRGLFAAVLEAPGAGAAPRPQPPRSRFSARSDR